MNIDLTEVILLIITILFAILQRYIIPWLKEKRIALANDDLDFWVDFFVKAAEEKYKEMANAGGLKFAYVMDLMKKQGFDFDDEVVAAAIDAKVRELFNWSDYGEDDENK